MAKKFYKMNPVITRLAALLAAYAILLLMFWRDWADFSAGLLDSSSDSFFALALGSLLTANLLPAPIHFYRKKLSSIFGSMWVSPNSLVSSELQAVSVGLSIVEWIALGYFLLGPTFA